MAAQHLDEFLADLVREALREERSRRANSIISIRGSAAHAEEDIDPLARQIVQELIAEALRFGLPIEGAKVNPRMLGGGNTADLVAQVTVHAAFAFKLDHAKPKLAAEGTAMRKIKMDESLPARFRAAWPTIYAVRSELPYAYLMEYFPEEEGWLSLEKRLFPGASGSPPTVPTTHRLIGAALDILFEGYEASRQPRLAPVAAVDYVQRIRERLDAAATLDNRFGPRPIVAAAGELRSWREYLKVLDDNPGYLREISAPFSTVSHGDPNPGNILLRLSGSGAEVKLIDPKEWVAGDYLFDIAKITHFVEVTGLVERPANGQPLAVQFELCNERAHIDYSLTRPEWVEHLSGACLERVERFAQAHGDLHWRARYELGMASNLLGLPEGRLKRRDPKRANDALILFVEGLQWLQRFCERLIPAATAAREPARSNPSIEPASLAANRDYVRQNVTNITEATDRRGFSLLHWPALRPNDQGKPIELSLEHEVRLQPTTEASLRRLRASLNDAKLPQVGQRLLPRADRFHVRRIQRYDRPLGPQSVDHYYDQKAGGLIDSLFTLRERIQGSKFMTWSSADPSMRALNIELPFVALGDVGLTARLELNWIDNLRACLQQALDPPLPQEPLHLAVHFGAKIRGAVPVLEHTTYREKFALVVDGEADLIINIDQVVAQDLATKAVGTYVDIDISMNQSTDAQVLQTLTEFSQALMASYDLEPNLLTKAARGAFVTGRSAC